MQGTHACGGRRFRRLLEEDGEARWGGRRKGGAGGVSCAFAQSAGGIYLAEVRFVDLGLVHRNLQKIPNPRLILRHPAQTRRQRPLHMLRRILRVIDIPLLETNLLQYPASDARAGGARRVDRYPEAERVLILSRFERQALIIQAGVEQRLRGEDGLDEVENLLWLSARKKVCAGGWSREYPVDFDLRPLLLFMLRRAFGYNWL